MARVPQFAVVLLLLSVALATSPPVWAQDEVLRREHHSWGRFQPGAWKEVRVVTQEFESDGRLARTATSRSRMVLVGVEEDGVTLEVEATVEMGGKQLAGPRQVVKEDFYGEVIGEADHRVANLLAPEAATIENQDFPCLVRQSESSDGNFRTTSTIHYSTKLPPYVLSVRRKTFDIATKTEISDTTAKVIALNWPFRVLDQVRTVTLVEKITQNEKQTRRSLIFSCPDVPGGIVAEMTKELDSGGRIVRRSLLEVVRYGVDGG